MEHQREGTRQGGPAHARKRKDPPVDQRAGHLGAESNTDADIADALPTAKRIAHRGGENLRRSRVLMELDGAKVTYIPNFISRDEADRMLREFMARNATGHGSTDRTEREGIEEQPLPPLEGVPWGRDIYRMYGKSVPAPRTAAMGDPGTTYTHTGNKRPAGPWSPSVHELKERIEAETGQPFNYCLLNLYASGEQYVGYHSDDEKDLVHGATIASISLGASRRFLVRPRASVGRRKGRGARMSHPVVVDAILEHGGLLLMEGDRMQHEYQHSVPKMAGVKGPRVNLTFRLIATTQ